MSSPEAGLGNTPEAGAKAPGAGDQAAAHEGPVIQGAIEENLDMNAPRVEGTHTKSLVKSCSTFICSY